jgi:hypothetical protein
MKILFLYDDKEHAWALLGARQAAAEIGLEIEACEEHSDQCFDRYVGHAFDCLLIHRPLLSELVVDCGRPVMILERIDGAQLGKSRLWVGDVAGILKGYCYRRGQLNNEVRGRFHAHTLWKAGFRGKSTCVQEGTPAPIAAADLAKIRPFYGFGAYQRQQPCLRTSPDLVAKRSTAVHFAGTVTYGGTEIEAHRRRAVKICRRIAGGVGIEGRKQKSGAYRQALLDSRCVLSPWGFGEACHRDYEAWALGAILIKPASDYVEGWPDVYHAGKTYLACRPDFADVPELVEEVRRDWAELEPMRRRCRKLAEDAADPWKIALRLKDCLEDVLR